MDTVLQAFKSALLFIIEATINLFAIFDKFYDHLYQTSVRNKPQKLAGQATMPHSVIGCSEVTKTAPAFFLRRNSPRFCGSSGRPKLQSILACLFLWYQRVGDRLDAVVDEPFKDLVRDAKQKDWAVDFSIVRGFVWLGNSNYQRTSPNF